MKKFFTQPIGDLARQNGITFLVINVVFIAVEFSGTTAHNLQLNNIQK